MALTKRVYLKTKKIFIYGSGTFLAFLILLLSLNNLGINVETSGDIACGRECISYFNISLSNYSLCFGSTFKGIYFDKNVNAEIYKADMRYSNSNPNRWKLYNFTSGKCFDKNKTYEFMIIGYKESSETVKWGLSLQGVDVDPYWFGYETNIKSALIKGENISKYGKIEITDKFDKKLVSLELKKNTDICENDCSAEAEIVLYKDGSLVDDVIFYNLGLGDNVSEDITYNFYIQNGTINVSVDSYSWVGIGKINITTGKEILKYQINGSHIEVRDNWVTYNVGDILKAGTYRIKLEGKKKPQDSIDWYIKTNGFWTDEWQLWGSASSGSVIQASPDGGDSLWAHSGGVRFVANQNVTLTSFRADSLVIANKYYLGTTAGGNQIGSNTLNVPVTVVNYNLTAGTTYYLVVNNSNGSAFTRRYKLSGVTYPYTSVGINTTGFVDGATVGTTQIHNIVELNWSISAITTPPDLVLNSPINYYNSSTALTFNCSSSSNTGVLNITLLIDGVVNTTITNTTALQNFSLSQSLAFSNGNYNWSCWSSDAEEQNKSETRFFNIDMIVPQISIVSPTPDDGATIVTNDFTVAVSVIETNIANVTGNLYNSTMDLINNSQFNITEYLCYQETANISTSCGGLNTGSYSSIGGSNMEKTYDGNWSSFGTLTITPKYLYINYTKPINATNGLWQIKDDYQIINISIPNACFQQNILQLRVNSWATPTAYLDYRCYNGTNFTSLLTNPSAYGFYEEAMIWNILNIYSQTYYNLPDGLYYYNVTATDTFNNQNSTLTRNITIDTKIADVDYNSPLGVIRFLNCSPDFENPNSYPQGQITTSNICYQESANVSTSCGGLATGNYAFENSEDWTNPNNIIDENWNTYGKGGANAIRNLTINYTKPSLVASTGHLWQIKTTFNFLNITIPNTCFNYLSNKISLRVQSYCPDPICSDYAIFYCLNSSGYSLIYTSSMGYWIYEEAMIWNMTFPAINMINNGTATGNYSVNLTSALATGWTLWASNDSLVNNITLSTTAQRIWSNVGVNESKSMWLAANCSFVRSNPNASVAIWVV